MMHRDRSGRKVRSTGFTLVEMLVVVAIVAVLGAIALPAFQRYRQSTFRGVVRSDLRNVVSAALHFSSIYGRLPTQLNGGNPCGPGPTTCDLSDGTRTLPNIVSVSRDVTLTYRAVSCPSGSQGFVVEGTHRELGTWKASFDSCTGIYQGF